jgi:two-component system CheB/CheR fusion protein
VEARHTVHVLSDCCTLQAIAAATNDDDIDIRGVELSDLCAADETISGGCLVLDAATGPGASVLEVLRPIARWAPTIVLAPQADIRLAVRAVKAGAFDVLAKPIDANEFRSAALAALKATTPASAQRRPLGQLVSHVAAREAVCSLTHRQHDILARILQGQPNKIIAADLGISQRTAENHRAAIMRKLGVSSISALVQVALAAC